MLRVLNDTSNMKQFVTRAERTNGGMRSIPSRRVCNELLLAGGKVARCIFEDDKQTEHTVLDFKGTGAEMHSGNGTLFTGKIADVPVIVKMPKSQRAIAKWSDEIYITQAMATAGIAPEVYVASEAPDKFIVMRRFDTDMIGYINDTLEAVYKQTSQKPIDARETRLVNSPDMVKAKIEELIGRISAQYKEHPETGLCFGDLRFENLVLDDTTFEVRQIDFDGTFCETNLSPGTNIELLLKLVISFVMSEENAAQLAQFGMWPPHGRLFYTDIKDNHYEEARVILTQIHEIEKQHFERNTGYMLNLARTMGQIETPWAYRLLKDYFPKR